MGQPTPSPDGAPGEVNQDVDHPIELDAIQGQETDPPAALRALETAKTFGLEDNARGYAPVPAMDTEAVATTDPTSLSPAKVPKALELRLYISHFLSTWNSRLFEFAAVLFLASIFPSTLLPMSVYALVRSGVAIFLAQPIGSWIDRGNRLAVVRFSIVGQRFAVAASCALFAVLEQRKAEMGGPLKSGLFAATVILACVEKLCAMMNLVSVERDWVGSEQSHSTFTILFLMSLGLGRCHYGR
jgi:hypothetical protein